MGKLPLSSSTVVVVVVGVTVSLVVRTSGGKRVSVVVVSRVFFGDVISMEVT